MRQSLSEFSQPVQHLVQPSEQHPVQHVVRNDLFLVLEASTNRASVALITDTAVLATADVLSKDPISGIRTEGIAPSIARIFVETHTRPANLTGIICGAGPGGFTSLRGAAAIAKGMCYGLRLPLYTVSTPELMVAEAGLTTGTYLTAIDAGRGECYTTPVDVVDAQVKGVGPVSIVACEALSQSASAAHATLLSTHGEGGVTPRAGAALRLLERIRSVGPVDLDRWEPAYGRLAEAQVKWEALHGRPLFV